MQKSAVVGQEMCSHFLMINIKNRAKIFQQVKYNRMGIENFRN